MAIYTFYVLDFDGYLVGATLTDCADDAAAIDHANELLAIVVASVEVWEGDRKVATISDENA